MTRLSSDLAALVPRDQVGVDGLEQRCQLLTELVLVPRRLSRMLSFHWLTHGGLLLNSWYLDRLLGEHWLIFVRVRVDVRLSGRQVG